MCRTCTRNPSACEQEMDPKYEQHKFMWGPQSNKVMYHFMWGPSEFNSTGSLKHYDISSRLNKINVPTLMVCGEYDESAPWSCKKYAVLIPKAKTVIVPQSGHALFKDNYHFVAKSIRQFLNEQSSEASNKPGLKKPSN